MPEENGGSSIEVASSEESGNVPAEEIVPATPTAAPVDSEPVVSPVVEEFELPDGRKVDAPTLAKEWKENFAPEFTRKSQELAALKNNPNGDPKPNLPEQPKSKYEDPNYVPTSYEEILKVGEERGAQRALQILEERETQKVESQRAIEDAVGTQLEEVKKTDPNVNENALFLHATKYKFTDLRLAHMNMKDMAEAAKKVQQVTEKNILKRSDAVSVTPNANGAPLNPSHYASSVEYLRALKAQGQ